MSPSLSSMFRPSVRLVAEVAGVPVLAAGVFWAPPFAAVEFITRFAFLSVVFAAWVRGFPFHLGTLLRFCPWVGAGTAGCIPRVAVLHWSPACSGLLGVSCPVRGRWGWRHPSAGLGHSSCAVPAVRQFGKGVLFSTTWCRSGLCCKDELFRTTWCRGGLGSTAWCRQRTELQRLEPHDLPGTAPPLVTSTLVFHFENPRQ